VAKLQQKRSEFYDILPYPGDAHKKATKQISA
jgi:hypothetical protein